MNCATSLRLYAPPWVPQELIISLYNKSRAIDIVYLDFKKAFDKVPHKRLKAEVMGYGNIDEAGN